MMTKTPLDSASFTRLKRQILIQKSSLGQSADQLLAATPIPTELGLQLTYRCNLRCIECFQWGENGEYTVSKQGESLAQEIPIEIIESLLEQTQANQASVYLWGGEPLMYRAWEPLMALLSKHKRHVVLCTNGIGIEKRLDSLSLLGENLVVLASVDGLQAANDAVRGKNTFKQVVRGLSACLEGRRRGSFKGEVAVSCVITDQNLEDTQNFVEYFSTLGVDSIYLVFPWHISKQTALAMDDFFRAKFLPHFPLRLQVEGAQASWHHFTYSLAPGMAPKVQSMMRKLRTQTHAARVRFQPDLSEADIEPMLSGAAKPVQGRVRCLSKFNRLSVLPNGDVTTCKLFPEFTLGNLGRQSLASLWRGPVMSKTLRGLDKELTPVCAKCVQLYLNGQSSYPTLS